MNGSTVEPEPVGIDPSLYPFEARIGLACVWIMVSILGLVGNSLVICSIILCKKLRTVTNAFVVNLSVADFWTSLSYPWISVALVSHGSWPLESEIPCQVAAVQFYTGLGASIYSLASIALNRMVLITQSMDTYRWWYSPRKVTVMIALTWIIPCIVVFLPPILGIGAFGYDPQDNTCSDKDGHPRGPEFNLAQSLGLYPVPMLIIICCYTALYIHLKRHFRMLKKKDTMQGSRSKPTIAESSVSFSVTVAASSGKTNASGDRSTHDIPLTVEPSFAETSSRIGAASEDFSGITSLDGSHAKKPVNGSVKNRASMELQRTVRDDETTSCHSDVANRVSTASSVHSVSSVQDPSARHRRAISRQQLAITKSLFLVFCIFTLLLSPYFISLSIPSSRKFALYGATITIFNSCVNPIVYAINHPQFKVVMRKIIQCRYSEIPEPSDCLKSVLTRQRRT